MENFDTPWDEYEKAFKVWRRIHPGYAPQIVVFQKRFERLKKEYFLLLVRHSQTKNSRYKTEAEELLKKAAAEFNTFSRHEVIATLSGK
jgi:hypothetical protein